MRRNTSRGIDTLLAAGGPGHGGRCGPARRPQPPPGGARPAAHAQPGACSPAWPRCSAWPRAARRSANSFDLGFALAPRLNAAGRLADMTLGIECLDHRRCLACRRNSAQQLDTINRERRARWKAACANVADAALERLMAAGGRATAAAGAGALRRELPRGRGGHRRRPPEGPPAPADLRLRARRRRARSRARGVRSRASTCAMRSTSSAKRQPTAAGCNASAATRWPPAARIAGADAAFVQRFDARARGRWRAEWLDAATLTRTLRTDGPLDLQWFNARDRGRARCAGLGPGLRGAGVLRRPCRSLQQRLVGEKHLKLRVKPRRRAERDAIWFGHAESLPSRVRAWPTALQPGRVQRPASACR
jgi:single-stranded-DNA-specific exonuclease